MEIEGREVNIEQDYLSPVTYIPGHANGNAGHPDCEQGVLISVRGDTAIVLYCAGRKAQATNPQDLVWG